MKNTFKLLAPGVCDLGFILTAFLLVAGCTPEAGRGKVVVYTSVDDTYARAVAEKYERETGVKVLLVTDTEETKSTGLVNRLIVEKTRPQADVFWSGDPARAALLKSRGVTTPYKSSAASPRQRELGDVDSHFTALSARLRVLIYNHHLVSMTNMPRSVFDLTNSIYRGRACMASPLFGTTSMHAVALIQVLGEESTRSFLAALALNEVAVLSSNGEVKRRVAAGDFAIGLTDSDDVSVALNDGKPVGWTLPDQDGFGALLIPNAVCLVSGGPNPEAGRRFIDFLLSKEVETLLAESSAVQIPLREGLPTPAFFPTALADIHLLTVNYPELAARMENLSTTFVGEWTRAQQERGRSRTR